MTGTYKIWIGFILCLAIVLSAMGWVTLTALRLDEAQADARRDEAEALRQEAQARRQEAEVRRQAAWEENVRLALWRMDSTLAPFVAQESVRPYFAYSAFVPVNRAYGNMFNDRGGGEMLVPSPLLTEKSPNVLVYFQFEPDGRLTSPQVPLGGNYKLAVPNQVSEETVQRAKKQLEQLAALFDRKKLIAMLPESTSEPVEMVVSPLQQDAGQRLAQKTQRYNDLQLRGRGAVEFSERNLAVQQQANTMAMNRDQQFQQLEQFQLAELMPTTDVRGVLMKPLWIDGHLILARRVPVGGKEYVQGCLLDWPAIKTSLLETVEDLLPEADLKPVTGTPGVDEARMLAALPVRLLPGKPATADLPIPGMPGLKTPAAAGGFLSPIRLSLLIAWICMLLAALAVAALLLGVMRLSERRASFVTAVTHELRTPLTTFQMYAEMLAEDMVQDDGQRRHYLATLRAEAVRLTHMVENVLAYARIERGRADGRVEWISLRQLIEPMKERLAGRAEQAGMQLEFDSADGAGECTVSANVSAVEQVLFNLVDNACKYAAKASDKRIHFRIEGHDGHATVSVRDHGPGIAPPVRRKLFRSFSKSAQEAAQTAPGVGLGLALSRRLARDMGGDLRIDESIEDGARFVLTLTKRT